MIFLFSINTTRHDSCNISKKYIPIVTKKFLFQMNCNSYSPSGFHDASQSSSSSNDENSEMLRNLYHEEQAIQLAIANNNSII